MQDTLARKLRVLRAERGLTLREAEELTGVDKDTLSKLERGVRHAQDVTLSRIARGYEIPFEKLIEEPAFAGKAEAPGEAGPPKGSVPPSESGEERRRVNLEEIRESYRPSREGLDQYCARWERRLAEDDLNRDSVLEFLAAADALLPVLTDAVVSELMELVRELGATGDDGVSDEMRAQSTMYQASNRYHDVGRKLQQVWQDRFATDADTAAPVIDFKAKRQELLLRRTG